MYTLPRVPIGITILSAVETTKYRKEIVNTEKQKQNWELKICNVERKRAFLSSEKTPWNSCQKS